MIVVLVVVVFVGSALLTLALCRAAGDADRALERQHLEHLEADLNLMAAGLAQPSSRVSS